MEITREFLEERIRNFDAEIERLKGLTDHTEGMRDACAALIERLAQKEETPGPVYGQSVPEDPK